jgi:hypothetical protein
VARLRRRLGDSQFDQAFSDGSRLTQQEAVATVRNQNGTGAQAPSGQTGKHSLGGRVSPSSR